MAATSAYVSDEKLSKTKIVEEAIALLVDDGMTGLNMRALAARLKIKAPTLYWHFPDKASIAGAVLETLFQRALDRMPACASWDVWMREFGRSLWRMQTETPFAPVLLATAELDSNHVFETGESRLEQEWATFPEGRKFLFLVQQDIQALVSGWSIFAQSRVAPKIEELLENGIEDHFLLLLDDYILLRKTRLEAIAAQSAAA
jgi:TetR/AcrR family tetracycline transcriptional repressor